MRLFLAVASLLTTAVVRASTLSPSLKLPMVEGLSYTEVYNLWKGYIDINYFVSADLFAGYETSLFQLNYQPNSAPLNVFDPTFYAELATHNYIEVNLFNHAKVRLRIDFVGVKFNVLAAELVWDFNRPDQVLFGGQDLVKKLCYGMSWAQRALALKVHPELNVYECEFGLIDYLTLTNPKKTAADASECEWRRYIPEQPIVSISFS